MPSVSKSTESFSSVPTVCFQYGQREYVASTHKFRVDDEVVWNFQTNVEPHFGKIEFIGEELRHGLAPNSDGTADMAVVAFNQTTCHLPGHITNPPQNRNVIPIEQLVLKNAGRLTLDATGQILTLIGNCVATKSGFTKIELEHFQIDEYIELRNKTKSINGQILTTGNVTNPTINSEVLCVGVKFDASLNTWKSDIFVIHQNANNAKVCKECAGGTLAFVPLTMLTYSEVNDDASYQAMTSPSSLALPSQPMPTSTQKDLKPDIPESHLFVGNCVAHENGIQNVTSSDIPVGANVLVRGKKCSLEGVIRITCTINDIGSEKYVGIEFKSPFDCIGDTINVKHTELQGQNVKACEKCKGGKLVLVLEKCFSLHFAKSRNDIVFQVL